ncbi:MAG: hypothetical protein ACLP3K_03485 [Candidatus Acidiferrales bacterium]
MNCDTDFAAGASAALRNAAKRLASIRGVEATHKGRPRRIFDESANQLESNIQLMTVLAIEHAKAQGEPFRNPFVRKGERLYPVRYR